jgi:hypothetical protein
VCRCCDRRRQGRALALSPRVGVRLRQGYSHAQNGDAIQGGFHNRRYIGSECRPLGAGVSGWRGTAIGRLTLIMARGHCLLRFVGLLPNALAQTNAVKQKHRCYEERQHSHGSYCGSSRRLLQASPRFPGFSPWPFEFMNCPAGPGMPSGTETKNSPPVISAQTGRGGRNMS